MNNPNRPDNTGIFHRDHFATCCSGFDQLGAVVAQMPSVEQLFTPARCVGSTDSQPAIAQSLQYVRGQVEADITEFTTWKTQLLSLGHQHTGECTKSFLILSLLQMLLTNIRLTDTQTSSCCSKATLRLLHIMKLGKKLCLCCYLPFPLSLFNRSTLGLCH